MIKILFFFRRYIIDRFIKNLQKKNLSNTLIKIFFIKFLLKIDQDILNYLKSSHLKNIKSFSYGGYLDLIVLFFFKRNPQIKKSNFFFEAGAYDGKKYSNTFLLEKKFKYKGILVEPLKKSFDLLKINRKDQICINAAITNKTGPKINFYTYSDQTTSSSLLKILPKTTNVMFKISKVKQMSLNHIFREYNLYADLVDVVFLDIEGLELNALINFDFLKYRPKLFVIEINNNSKLGIKYKIHNLLKKNYYEVLYPNSFINNYVNVFFVNSKFKNYF
jgi:FkbM family methyltransferase